MLVPTLLLAVYLAISSAPSVQASNGSDSPRSLEAICSDTSAIYHSAARISACTRLIRGQVGTPHQRAEVYRTRGIALKVLGRHTDALRDFDQALSVDPDFTDVLLRRANQRSKLGDQVGALADFDRAVRSRQHDPAILEARAYFYLSNNNAKRAAADFDSALRLRGPNDPDLYGVYHNRGLYEFENGDYTSAIDHLSLGIASRADDPLELSIEYRGQAYLAVGDPERALADFTRLAESPSYASYAQVLRARALNALGRHGEARLAELWASIRDTAGKRLHPRDPREGLAIQVTAALNARVPMLTPYMRELVLRCQIVSWVIVQREPQLWACPDKLPVPRPL